MQNRLSTETKNELSKLGLYQIGGAAIGCILVIRSFFLERAVDRPDLFSALIMFAVFGYSIFCGVLCLEPRRNATLHSFINQLLQLLGFAVLGFSFEYAAGLYISLGIDLTEGIQVTFGAGISRLHFTINGASEKFLLSFNGIAFLLLVWIDRISKKVKEESAQRLDTDFL